MTPEGTEWKCEVIEKEYELTEEEVQEIRELYGKKVAIIELLACIGNNAAVYQNLKNDFVDVCREYQAWFEKFEGGHGAKGAPGYSWSVNFSARKVRLTKGAAAA